MKGLLTELRRRRVLRAAALYIVGAWIVIQVAGEAFDAWGIPEQVLRYIWIAAILGFPLALVFGWRYDITSGGIVRTRPADPSTPDDTSLKLIDYAVLAALAIVLALIGYGLARQAADAPAGPVDLKSIAVLPFTNISGDDANRPFTIGIHDDILTQVSKISELKVISRTSVANLDETVTVREISELLGVSTVLEGGVQRVGNQLRINVQLIDASTDNHMWAETYDRELTTGNIFAIQSEIAQAVAVALHATLSVREQKSLDKIPTQNFEAYEAYLLGRQRMALRAIPALQQAQASFERAVELDPDYALAHVGLADSLLLLNNYGALPLDEAVERAERLLERALELDPELAAAHASLGLSLARQARTNEAQVAFERAVALDPNYAPAYHWYADTLYNGARDFERALPLLQRARKLDPLSPVINVSLGEVYQGLGEFDEARALAEKVLELEPEYPGAYRLLADLNRFAFGRLDESIKWYVREQRRRSGQPPAIIGFSYLDLGDDVRAQEWFERALADHPDSFWTTAGLSQLHRYRNEAEEAVRYAEQLQQVFPGNNTTLVTLVDFDRDERVLEILAELFPEFVCSEAAIDRSNFFEAINVSLAMERTGDTGCADLILGAALEVVREIPRLGLYGYGIADVEIYARQGQTELALTTLREAIDEGWRAWWWAQGLASPHNASIADDPRFIEMMNEVQADLARQLVNVRRMEAEGELDISPGP